MTKHLADNELALTKDQIKFLTVLFGRFDDLPDGAWQAACEDAVRNCRCFKDQDPHEVWLSWCWETRVE